MDFMEQWQAISARIRGLSSAAELHASFLKVRDSDSFGRGKYLSEQCSEVFSAIEMFVNTFRASLPPAAVTAIDSFINARRSLFKEAVQGPDTHDERNRAVLIFLPTLETQVSFLLRDNQPAIRARSELAFSHLQRSIAADPDVRKKWQAAYDEGETRCEGLGAVHLLSHGIYAFKITGEKARTDLVYQDAMTTHPMEYVAGLVLTEWKKAAPGKTST
jgi:hypothetical protein